MQEKLRNLTHVTWLGGKITVGKRRQRFSRFECPICRYKWRTCIYDVLRGIGCPKCARARQKFTIEECENYAVTIGGHCLSKRYHGAKKPVRWECAEGHRWKACWKDVKRGSWCKTCVADILRGDISQCQVLATPHGGKCLSTAYTTSRAKYKWECAKGHQWKASRDHIKNGQWCPICRSTGGVSEEQVRRVFERLTQAKFPKARPKWLKGLELDGYNERLGIAFERQGEHHYTHGWWHRDKKKAQAALELQKKRDKRKLNACNYRGIRLIRVPHYIKDVAL